MRAGRASRPARNSCQRVAGPPRRYGTNRGSPTASFHCISTTGICRAGANHASTVPVPMRACPWPIHTRPLRTTTRSARGDSCVSARELSWRTGSSVRSLLSWTNRSSRCEPTPAEAPLLLWQAAGVSAHAGLAPAWMTRGSGKRSRGLSAVPRQAVAARGADGPRLKRSWLSLGARSDSPEVESTARLSVRRDSAVRSLYTGTSNGDGGSKRVRNKRLCRCFHQCLRPICDRFRHVARGLRPRVANR